MGYSSRTLRLYDLSTREVHLLNIFSNIFSLNLSKSKMPLVASKNYMDCSKKSHIITCDLTLSPRPHNQTLLYRSHQRDTHSGALLIIYQIQKPKLQVNVISQNTVAINCSNSSDLIKSELLNKVHCC